MAYTEIPSEILLHTRVPHKSPSST